MRAAEVGDRGLFRITCRLNTPTLPSGFRCVRVLAAEVGDRGLSHIALLTQPRPVVIKGASFDTASSMTPLPSQCKCISAFLFAVDLLIEQTQLCLGVFAVNLGNLVHEELYLTVLTGLTGFYPASSRNLCCAPIPKEFDRSETVILGNLRKPT